MRLVVTSGILHERGIPHIRVKPGKLGANLGVHAIKVGGADLNFGCGSSHAAVPHGH